MDIPEELLGRTDSLPTLDDFEIDDKPGMIIVFSDMESDIGMIEDPGIPTIWANTSPAMYQDPTFGEVVQIDPDYFKEPKERNHT